MINQRWYEFGTVFGMRYLFDEIGDGLEFHKHLPAHEHSVIVLRGLLRIRGRNEDGGISPGIMVKAPAIIDILPDEHELVAMESRTEILNLYKYGKPPEYDNLPESEKAVSIPCVSLY